MWGCSAYVLDPLLQGGKHIPEWYLKNRQGRYLEKLSDHASLVELKQNLRTGFISPQLRMVYDDAFQIFMVGFEDNEAIANPI